MSLKKMFLLLAMVTFVLFLQSCDKSPEAGSSKPLLIEYGQTTPDPKLMRKYVDYWEEYLPFDGVVFTVNQNRYAGRFGITSSNSIDTVNWSLESGVFANRKLRLEDFSDAIDDLKATNFKKFKHNFLWANCYPKMGSALNWFDDEHWANVLNNIGIVATIAKQGGCVGILLDTEVYGDAQIWTYTKLKETFPDSPQDWESYRKMVYKRGKEFIEAINEKFPGCEFPLLFGSCLTHERMAGAQGIKDSYEYKPGADVDFSGGREALISPFLDGLIAGADKDTKITDWFEMSYYYKTEEQFAKIETIVRDRCSAYSLYPEIYREKIQTGVGLFPTHPPQRGRNFTADEVAKSVEYGLKHTDKYVWIWNETKTFWVKGGPEGKPMLAYQPMVNSSNPDPSHLTDSVTEDNALAENYHGVDTDFIDAIAAGKAVALK